MIRVQFVLGKFDMSNFCAKIHREHMYCRNCGKELPTGSNYCPDCGAKQFLIENDSKIHLPKIISNHKKLSYAYIVWFLAHLTLFISSSKQNTEGFYPWNKPLNDVLTYLFGGKSSYFVYDFSWFDKYNVYDFSEFFVYTILLPATIYGVIYYLPYMKPSISKGITFLRNKYFSWHKGQKQQKVDSSNNTSSQSTVSDSNEPTISDEVLIEQVMPSPNMDGYINGTCKIDITDVEKTSPKDNGEIEIQSMPLIGRFIGSLIDKVIILFIFVIGFIIISPFGASGKMGTYVGLLNCSPNNYEYIDKVRIENYGYDNPGVDDYNQAQSRLANGAPSMGSTRELDLSITLAFILLNLIYYILFECILLASPGKRMFGGMLINSNKEKIGIGAVFARAICSGALMVFAVFFLHFQIGFSYLIVFVLFFLLLDIPIFFTKQSLIDLCTGTVYAKRI